LDFETVPIVWYWFNPTFSEYNNKAYYIGTPIPVKLRFKMTLFIVISIFNQFIFEIFKVINIPPYYISMRN